MEDLRDTEWKNLRRATINKRDNTRTTGGEEVKMTELDDLILQVMDRPTNPMVTGLDVRGSTNAKTTEEGDKTYTLLKPATVATNLPSVCRLHQ